LSRITAISFKRLGATLPFCLLALGSAFALAGCQSTQAKSAELAKQGAKLIDTGVVQIGNESTQVDVLDTALLTDQYGTAVAVTLKNNSDRFLTNLPVQIDVRDKKGKTIFKNDQVGTVPALLGYPLVGPGQTVTWVHDQVLISGKAASVKVTVGSKVDAPPAGEPPKIEVSQTHLHNDPVSGVELIGKAENLSPIDQQDLTFFVVARKGGKIVAAGRGGLKKLSGGQKVEFSNFFIGNPLGADVTVEAPPTTLN